MADNYKEMYAKSKHRKDSSSSSANEKSLDNGSKSGKNLNAGRK